MLRWRLKWRRREVARNFPSCRFSIAIYLAPLVKSNKNRLLTLATPIITVRRWNRRLSKCLACKALELSSV
jgi:hypothetical protein